MNADAPSSPYLTPTVSKVSARDRRARNGHRGAVVWLTGLSASGKSTLAIATELTLFDCGLHAFVLDGDNVRQGLSADLGFSAGDRAENIRRVAHTARLMAEAGLVVVAAFISPFRDDRIRARRIVEQSSCQVPFREVFLDVDVSVCEGRDPKQLYARARAGEIPHFTGVSAPYERPDSPDLVIRTGECTVEEAVQQLVAHLLPAVL